MLAHIMDTPTPAPPVAAIYRLRPPNPVACSHWLLQNFDDVKTLFMQSDGGLTPVASFRGSRAILSGPAGGVVGYAATSYSGEEGGEKQPVIGFDMGGTSTGEWGAVAGGGGGGVLVSCRAVVVGP